MAVAASCGRYPAGAINLEWLSPLVFQAYCGLKLAGYQITVRASANEVGTVAYRARAVSGIVFSIAAGGMIGSLDYGGISQ